MLQQHLLRDQVPIAEHLWWIQHSSLRVCSQCCSYDLWCLSECFGWFLFWDQRF